MAAHYAREIRSLQPNGPYHLMGHSLGGWIAYAVAQELTGQGEKVALLAMLDTQENCDLPWHLRPRERLNYYVSQLRWHRDQLTDTPFLAGSHTSKIAGKTFARDWQMPGGLPR